VEERPATPWHLTVRSYAEVRPELRTGDLVLFWGRGPLSRLISDVTQGPSHAETLLVSSELDIVFALGSVEGQGCRLVMLSRLIEDQRTRYDGAVVILRHRQPVSSAVERTAARVYLSDLGEGYGYRTLVLAGLRKLLLLVSPRLERWLYDRYDVLRTVFICSEKSAETFVLKAQALTRYANTVPEPVDLWRDENLDVVARVL